MDFKHLSPANFAYARDFLYLAAFFLGAGTGCILNRYKRNKTGRYRDLSLTAGLLFFSGTVIALTLAAIYSNWIIFNETSLYLPTVILMLILALVLRFPRAIGFPVFLASGVFMVWIAYSCLRFPVFDNGRGDFTSAVSQADYSGWCQVIREGSGSIHVRPYSASMAEPDIILPDGSVKNSSFLEFKAVEIAIHRNFPIIGGKNRVILTEITAIGQIDQKILYSDARLNLNSFPNYYLRSGSRADEAPKRFISFNEALGRLEPGKLVPGIGQDIEFN